MRVNINEARAVGLIEIDWSSRKIHVSGMGGENHAENMTAAEVMTAIGEPSCADVERLALALWDDQSNQEPQLSLYRADEITLGDERDDESDWYEAYCGTCGRGFDLETGPECDCDDDGICQACGARVCGTGCPGAQ